MKYFLVLFLLISTPAFADWYVINIDNDVIAKCNYQPDTADLESRNEVAVYVTENISLEEAEYRGNKIVKHVKTADEIEAEEEVIEITQEEIEVMTWIRDYGITELRKGGKVFDKIKKSDE